MAGMATVALPQLSHLLQRVTIDGTHAPYNGYRRICWHCVHAVDSHSVRSRYAPRV